jgi:hypothetical protein
MLSCKESHCFLEIHQPPPPFSGGFCLAVIFLAVPFLFSGCDSLKDTDAGGGGWTMPIVVNKDSKSIKAKFDIEGPQSVKTVKKVFNTLHEFIQAGGLEQFPDVIKTGDWIDLEGGLEVDAYGGQEGANGGEILLDAGNGVSNPELRLVVVGINSFRSGRGADGNYEETANDGVDHVVFHFKGIPGKHRMNATGSTDGGYAISEMRDYVTGNFLVGLRNAGVPEEVLWGPKRHVSAGMNGSGASVLSDLLWLPTARELYENNEDYNWPEGALAADGETAENQARLEYYTSDYSCEKSGALTYYWLASVYPTEPWFCMSFSGTGVASSGNSGGGCAPAFCVK